MKTLSIIALVLLCAGHAFAQDRVITKEGDVFNAYRIDIGGTYIYYTKEDKEGAALQKIAKGDVLMIKKKDGTKIEMTEQTTASSQTTRTETEEKTGITNVKIEDLSTEAKAANDKLIAKINAPVKLNVVEKHQKDIGKKEASSSYACFGVTPNSILCDDNIEVTCHFGKLMKSSKNTPAEWENNVFNAYFKGTDNPAILFSIKNKTSQTIYLDLANTFYVSMGQSSCYYVPTSTTTSSTSSSGAGLNLGAVTGALGIGGIAGTVANGVNVGGGSSNTITNTTYSQRIIAIAPLSTIDLSAKYIFGNEIKSISKGLRYELLFANRSYDYCATANFSPNSQSGAMMFGDHYVYSFDSSPIKMSFFVAYAKFESCTSEKVLSSHYYLNNMLGTVISGWIGVWGNISNYVPYFVMKVTNNTDQESFPKQ